jgi:hypothetical protein
MTLFFREEASRLSSGSTATKVFPGLRTEPRKKDVRQPKQALSGLKVREEFQVPKDSDDSGEYKSDVSDEDEDEDNLDDEAPDEEGKVDVEEVLEGEEEESSDDGDSSEPEFEDLV